MTSDHDPARAQAGFPLTAHEDSGDITTMTPPNILSATDLQTLSNYRDAVDTLLRLHSSSPISNSIPAHAAILFEKFFEYARNHVRIFSHELNPEVFGGSAVVDMARWVVGKHNVRVSVITQAEPKPSAFLDFLRSKELGVSLTVAQSQQALEMPNNFAVMDDAAVRVETDRSKCKATAVMNSPELARQWAKFFDKILLTERAQPAISGSV